MDIFTESTLADSLIYNTFNRDKSITMKIGDALRQGTELDDSYIEEQLMMIKKTSISPLMPKVLQAYNDRDISLLYCHTVKIPSFFPFVVIRQGESLKCKILINNFSGLTPDKDALTINMKDLYVLMEAAYIALSYQQYPVKLERDMYLLRLTTNIYTLMIMRILSKEYSLSLDKSLYDKTTNVVARFYIDNVWGCKTRDISKNYAATVCLNPNRTDLDIINELYDAAEVKDIGKLMEFIRTMDDRFSTINIRYFTECYINMFRPGAVLGMDCLPYFFYTLIVSHLGSFLVNSNVVGDIMKNTKGMNLFYSELAKIF